MKKFLTIIAIALTTNFVFGQGGENELKNFRFGLKITPSVNWGKPEGKILATDGPVVRFGGGLVMEFRLAKIISIQTGLQVDLDGGKIKYNNGDLSAPNTNTVSYYYSVLDDEIVKYNPSLSSSASYIHYQLDERNYKVTYITIPLTLKMKTKEIGAFTYYGQIGMNNSFRWKATADDVLREIKSNSLGTQDSKSKVDITKDISIYTAFLNFGLGAELNFSGTTALTFGLNYNLGFTNVVKSDSDYLRRRANSADYTSTNNSTAYYTISKLPQSINANAILINVGLLF